MPDPLCPAAPQPTTWKVVTFKDGQKTETLVTATTQREAKQQAPEGTIFKATKVFGDADIDRSPGTTATSSTGKSDAGERGDSSGSSWWRDRWTGLLSPPTGVIKSPSDYSPAEMRLEASREYVRLYGPIPKSGTAANKEYKAITTEIQKAMQAGTYKPPDNIKLNVYELDTQRGTKTVEAVDVAQVKRLAAGYGLDVSDINKVGEAEYTPSQALKKLATASSGGKRYAAEALIAYGSAFGQELGTKYFGPEYEQLPAGVVPIRIGRDMSYIPKDVADQLMGTQAYQKARGLQSARLGIALVAAQKDHDAWLSKLETEDHRAYLIYTRLGPDKLQEYYERQQKAIDALENYKSKDGCPGGICKYDIMGALFDKAITVTDLRLLKFDGKDIMEANQAASEMLAIEKDFLKNMEPLQIRMIIGQSGAGWDGAKTYPGYEGLSSESKQKVLEYYATTIKPGPWKAHWEWARKHSIDPIMAITPIAGTIYYWNKMSTTWRAISIATDVICVGFIIHAAAAAARAARGYTAAARIKAALKGAGSMALAEMTAPAEMLAHPIRTSKGVITNVRSAIETIFHPKKVPLGGVELTYTTARLPIRDVGGTKKALELRDAVVQAAIQGKKATATVEGITLELKPAMIQKLGGPIAIHATPDIRPYLNGAIIGGSTEGYRGLFISPNFHSRFAQATSTGLIPQGGIKGGVIINDPSLLKKVVTSGKAYLGTAEIEAKLAAGLKLPPPSQVLFTRDIAGNKLTLLVIGRPFSASQVAKLKILGGMDTVGQIFKPTMKLTGAQQSGIQSMDDLIALTQKQAQLQRQLDAAQAARNLATAQNVQRQLADVAGQIDDLAKRINAARAAMSPRTMAWAQFSEKGLLQRYGELSARSKVGTSQYKLPDMRLGQAVGRASAYTWGRQVAPTDKYSPIQLPRYESSYSTKYAPYKMPAYIPPSQTKYAPPGKPEKTMPRLEPPSRVARPSPSLALGKAPSVRGKSLAVSMKEKRIPQPGQALVTWRQGAYWITIVEPFRTGKGKPDVIYSREQPPWAKKATGKKSPMRSLFTKGKLPRTIDLNMGQVVARVKQGRELVFFES